jgi:hypothetical protein
MVTIIDGTKIVNPVVYDRDGRMTVAFEVKTVDGREGEICSFYLRLGMMALLGLENGDFVQFPADSAEQLSIGGSICADEKVVTFASSGGLDHSVCYTMPRAACQELFRMMFERRRCG